MCGAVPRKPAAASHMLPQCLKWVKRVNASMSVTARLRPWDLPKHRITANWRDVPPTDMFARNIEEGFRLAPKSRVLGPSLRLTHDVDKPMENDHRFVENTDGGRRHDNFEEAAATGGHQKCRSRAKTVDCTVSHDRGDGELTRVLQGKSSNADGFGIKDRSYQGPQNAFPLGLGWLWLRASRSNFWQV